MRALRGWVAFVVAISIGSAFAQLNPTVKVLPKPQTSVPPECEQGLAPAAPRVIIAEATTEEKKPVAPPSLDLKTRLRAVQIAAEHNDRDAFKAALGDARSAVNSYPPGGERNAAADVLSVYNDLERLWDYQFTSPVGAFFDSGTDFVSMMRRYSDYPAAIRDQTLTSNGQTIYPTEETRKFLIVEAARRLDRLGVRTPTRIVEAPQPAPAPVTTPAPTPRVVPSPVPKHAPKAKVAAKKPVTVKPKQPVHKAAHAAKKKTPATTPTKAPTKIAEAKTAPAMPRHVERAPKPQPAPAPVPQPPPAPQPVVQPKPQPQPIVTPSPQPPAPQPPAPQPLVQPKPQPQPVVTPSPQPQPPTTTTTAEAPPQPPTATNTTTTATTATATTTTAVPAQKPAEQGGSRVNLLLSVILIIAGIGVLFILLRASD